MQVAEPLRPPSTDMRPHSVPQPLPQQRLHRMLRAVRVAASGQVAPLL
jgi:hypothetical protein